MRKRATVSAGLAVAGSIAASAPPAAASATGGGSVQAHDGLSAADPAYVAGLSGGHLELVRRHG